MGRISSPVLFSEYFGIQKNALEELGVFDPFLGFDNKLFIDPLLLNLSSHSEMRDASALYEEFFIVIFKLLQKSESPGDITWKAAEDRFKFKEFKGTCLGYGDKSIYGSGWGPVMINDTLARAQKIITLGIEDTHFFSLVFLFQDLIGPDKISDMATHIILPELINFNKRIYKELEISDFNPYQIGKHVYRLPANPTDIRVPIVLVPKDILRDLPVATNWQEVCRAAERTQALRERINAHIGDLWKHNVNKEEKKEIWDKISNSKWLFRNLLSTIKGIKKRAYDFRKDPEGITFWSEILYKIDKEHPLDLSKYKNDDPQSIDTIYALVRDIIDHFKTLIEDKGLWTELWVDKKVRKESCMQKLFFAVAESYCKAHNLDITPEAETGNGPVDFKFSIGYNGRVIVEIKKSNNSKIVHGYEKQLEIYKQAESTDKAIFLIIKVCDFDEKLIEINKIREKRLDKDGNASEVILIDGTLRASASKR